MTANVRRLDGVVLIDAGTARTLAYALGVLGVEVRKNGGKLTPPILALRDQLTAAAGTSADVDARTSDAEWISQLRPASSMHDLLDTATAAKLLGCTPGNVRDLARRRVLPARRSGGRWFVDADAVRERAQHISH